MTKWLFLIFLTAAFFWLYLSGWRVFVVQSGSMVPALSKGSIILTSHQPDYSVVEIITFQDPHGQLITHRIVKKEGEQFTTQGDQNNVTDRASVAKKNIIGSIKFQIPLLGKPILLIKKFLSRI